MRFIPAANPSEDWHHLLLDEDCRDTDKESKSRKHSLTEVYKYALY